LWILVLFEAAVVMDHLRGPHSCAEGGVHYVCRCLRVTEEAIAEAVATQAVRSLKDIRRHTGAGDGCMACHKRLARYLDRPAYSSSSPPICSVK
jgi:bacterioferritin-associated ferredoxin